jgi:hypothetical protein
MPTVGFHVKYRSAMRILDSSRNQVLVHATVENSRALYHGVEIGNAQEHRSKLESLFRDQFQDVHMHEAIDTSLAHGEMGISSLSGPIVDATIITWVTPA